MNKRLWIFPLGQRNMEAKVHSQKCVLTFVNSSNFPVLLGHRDDEWVASRKEVLQPSTGIVLHPLHDEIYIDGSSGYFQANEFCFRKCDWCGCVSMHTPLVWWQVSSDGQSFVLMRQRLEVQYLCGPLSFCIIHVPRLLPIPATCLENVCLQSGGGAM